MKRGISFEIPNKFGSFLGEILRPINISSYNWYIGGEESYFAINGELDEPLFPEMICGMNGEELKKIIENNTYYLIFANLNAFPIGKSATELTTYEEYIESECILSLLVIDSSYVSIYCKDPDLIEDLYKNALNKNFEKLKFVTDENNTRTKLSVW